jgi:hypothetical protein
MRNTTNPLKKEDRVMLALIYATAFVILLSVLLLRGLP